VAKSKPGKTKKQKSDSKKLDNGSAEIRRAEKRLAKALAGVDDAREKAQLRERDLVKLMERHGRAASVSPVTDEAIPLEAPSHAVADNGATQHEDPVDATEPVEQPVEQPISSDSDEHDEEGGTQIGQGTADPGA
jgi:hypothetical protein